LSFGNYHVKLPKIKGATMVTTLDRFGRIPIPKKIREDLDLKPGSQIRIEKAGQTIILKPVRGDPNLVLKDGVLVYSGTAVGDLERALERRREESRVAASSWAGINPAPTQSSALSAASPLPVTHDSLLFALCIFQSAIRNLQSAIQRIKDPNSKIQNHDGSSLITHHFFTRPCLMRIAASPLANLLSAFRRRCPNKIRRLP
jgi:AbrB family looped-hinge helix DNA binding protein